MYNSTIKELAIADTFEDQQTNFLTESTNKLLKLLIEIYDQKNLAAELKDLGLEINRESLNKWKKDPIKSPLRIDEPSQKLIRDKLLPARPKHYDKPSFTFIDLFAGIGGLRTAFEGIKGQCVYTSEYNAPARRTYLANHYIEDDELGYFLEDEDVRPEDYKREKNKSYMDIRRVTLSPIADESGAHSRYNKVVNKAGRKEIEDNINFHIPDHDMLLAGFPCQPFSIAGVSKKNALGRSHGFDCESQGTLFFDVEKILKVKKPKFFLLENVKNLKSHDKGKTFAVIIRALDKLGYWISDISNEEESIEEIIEKVRKRKPEPVILDGQKFVPQHRERIALVGVRKNLSYEGLSLANVKKYYPKSRITLKDILDKEVPKNYILTDNLWEYLFNYAIKHKKKGNGFGFGLVDPEDPDAVCRCLSARYYKDGSEILVNFQGLEKDYLAKAFIDPQKLNKKYKKPRRLTPRECARLMGFEKPGCDDSFRIPVSDTQAYKQCGNSIVVPVFQAVAKLMKPYIQKANK